MTSKKMAVGLTCCYFKHLGWPARQIMTNPILTAIIGAYMDTKLSTRRISGFIRANGLYKAGILLLQRLFHPAGQGRRASDKHRP